MVNIDALLSEWAYRCKKGYPDMDSPSDLRVLKTILKEQKISLPQLKEEENEKEKGKEPSKEELIDLINKSDLTPKALARITKIVKGTAFRSKTKNLLAKVGYTEKDFKSGEVDLDSILNTITNSEVDILFNYLENPKALSSFPTRGNLIKQLGMPEGLVKDLMNIEGVDDGGSNIGKIEIFLALVLSDVNNRKGGGDLDWDGVGNLEIKGDQGRAGAQKRGNFVNGQNRIADRFIPIGEEREEFEASGENRYMNFCLKNAFDYIVKNKGDVKEYISYVQKLLDEIFFNKGLAKKYFSKADDFKDLGEMRNSIFKLNIDAYAEKTNVDAFMFANANTGEYAIINLDKVGEAIDQGIVRIRVSPVLGYKWDDPNPNITLGKK